MDPHVTNGVYYYRCGSYAQVVVSFDRIVSQAWGRSGHVIIVIVQALGIDPVHRVAVDIGVGFPCLHGLRIAGNELRRSWVIVAGAQINQP